MPEAKNVAGGVCSTQLQQQNVIVGGVTFADLVREAMDGAGA